MNEELRAYADSIEKRLELICAAVAGMTRDELNARPAADANSAWVLATHAIGNARAWVLGIACGRAMRRDRPAEFASHGDDAASLIAEARACAAELREALGSLDPGRLDERVTPSKELWGEHEPHEISVRQAILQVIEHASLHAGHLQVTRDVVKR